MLHKLTLIQLCAQRIILKAATIIVYDIGTAPGKQQYAMPAMNIEETLIASLQLQVDTHTEQATMSVKPGSPTLTIDSPEIWIAHIRHGRSYLEKQLKAPNTEQQLLALKKHYQQYLSRRHRFVLRWFFCRRIVIYIGELTVRSRETPTECIRH